MSEATTTLPIPECLLDPRLQARVELRQDAVTEYAEAYREAPESLPPIAVWRVGSEHYVVDGWHRVAAAITAGLGWIAVEVVGEGSIEQAVWHAAGVNRTHGVRRSREDVRRAIEIALSVADELQASSRAIAAQVGCHHTTVETHRQVANSPPEPHRQVANSPPEPRRGRDGKTYPAASAAPDARTEPGGDSEASPEEWPEPPEPGDGTPLDDEPAASLPPYTGALASAASEILTVRRRVVATLGQHGLAQLGSRVRKALTDAASALDGATPVPCPVCGGEGCQRCGGQGWVPKIEMTARERKGG